MDLKDYLEQLDDDLWVELILNSPQSVINICMMLSLEYQLEKEKNKTSSEVVSKRDIIIPS